MSEVKRKLSEVSDGLGSPHDDKKLHIKPGRKPVDTEPKSKRTAQNRAAQRAYRERKEKRMGELEVKVKHLEDQKIRASTESDFLRAQVDILKKELSLYRGRHDMRDLEAKLSIPLERKSNQFSQLQNPVDKDTVEQSNVASGSSEEFNGRHSSSFSTSRSDLSNNSIGENKSFIMSPTSNLQGPSSNSHSEKESLSQRQVPDLVSWSSSSTSPLDNYASPKMQDSNLNDLNYGKGFDEQVDPFCAKLNEACGTKECPIPKDKRSLYGNEKDFDQKQESSHGSGISPQSFVPGTSDLYFKDDPLASLNDNNFDVSLALGDDLYDGSERFGDGRDFPSWLVEEQSAYDILNPNNIFNVDNYMSNQRSLSREEDSGTVKENKPVHEGAENSNSDENNDVVPAPEEHVKCSEIWDRIVSHPKYTELDIDGLCSELKSKAKCCESGVVISSSDVNKLITKSVSDKQ